ncbi:tetratricopeptide repeat protein [Streptomyces sp. NPDC088182]|uniref:tetratricopeptide repeat protein n=1 Tax=Streptomyces sp. NPDC088182 TaxID=3365838 RepID=UPI00382BA989
MGESARRAGPAGRGAAAAATAGLLEEWGRGEEAVALARTHMASTRSYAETGGGPALASFARLLARNGLTDEAFDLLRPHIDDWSLAKALIDVAQGAGRDEEAAGLLAARIPAGHACDSPRCCRGLEPHLAIGLLATVHERQDRVEEAVALLSTRQFTSLNGRDQLADLFARHNRIDELRSYADTEPLGHAARRLAELLEERGDVDGAITVYRQAGKASIRRGNAAVELARLLARHDRYDDAIEVMRALADVPGGAEDWIVDVLCTLYADQGRPQDALTWLDDLKARRGKEEWELFWIRLPLMAACGRVDEAVELTRAHPEGTTSYAAEHVATLLANAGRTEDAVIVLEQYAPANTSTLAGYLIDLGRPTTARRTDDTAVAGRATILKVPPGTGLQAARPSYLRECTDETRLPFDIRLPMTRLIPSDLDVCRYRHTIALWHEQRRHRTSSTPSPSRSAGRSWYCCGLVSGR